MSLSQIIKSLHRVSVTSEATGLAVYPVGAPVAAISDGAAGAWAWSAYVAVVVAGTVPNPCWLAGVHLDTPVVEAFSGDFAIATGLLGAQVDRAIFSFNEQLFAVVEGKSKDIMLPVPIRITGAPALWVRVRKSTAASAAGASLKVYVLSAVG